MFGISNLRFITDAVVIIVALVTGFYLYQNYWDDFKTTMLSEETVHTIYIGSSAISVTVADTEEERILGLSGTESLREREGKLFIFDRDGRYGIWMKEMKMPLDIIWIDKDLRIVHIAENVLPETFPEVFSPPSEARFVLEMNAYFVSSLRVKIGDVLTLPSILLPEDIKQNLQQ
jgi:uncharacterized membrane protein (UPF0127 family)